MTRRTVRCAPRGRAGATAALAVAVLLLVGCGSGDTGAADGTPASPGRNGSPSEAARDAVDQSTPGLAARSYFTAVGDARFADACRVLAPVVRARYASAGQDCQTALAGLFDEETRAAIGKVVAEDSAVEITGDTALVPGTALTRSDLPDGAERPSFPDVRASRQGGLWYLVL